MSGVLRDGLSAGLIPPQDEREGVSRRAVLGAAVGIPLMPGDLGSSFRRMPESTCLSAVEERWTPDQVRGDGEWHGALKTFRAAEAEMRAVERATAGGSAEAEEIWLPVYEARLDLLSGAVRAVMLVPAPGFAAFADKLELFFEHELEPHSVEKVVLAAIRADVRRLAGVA
jgi:hypothetical protein